MNTFLLPINAGIYQVPMVGVSFAHALFNVSSSSEKYYVIVIFLWVKKM